MAEDGEAVKKEAAESEEAPRDIQSRVQEAMHSRVHDFEAQADSLTFEGVRRLLEKDLGLEKYALDVHKRFVKRCLSECLDGPATDNACKDSGETWEKQDNSAREKLEESPGGPHSNNGIKGTCSDDEEKMEDSPVMGLLTGQKAAKVDTEEIPANKNSKVPSEASIKRALQKRAAYIKTNSDKVTMGGLRRLLEEDLKLEIYTLDPYKKFISKQLDEVLKSPEVSTPKKKTPKKSSQAKASKRVSSEGCSDFSAEESNEEDEDEVNPKQKIGSKKNMLNSEGSKKRKRPEKETNTSAEKRIKDLETVVEDNSDAENGANASEDSLSQSSAEKPVKKKESASQAYGKHVEHLKSVIKSCGMSVPPSVYKKVKQVPENKREAQLIKELEDMLSREGLSSKPSEKEIKEVKRRKERAKELEGIDTSNIVSSSRRRSTTSYVPPPKPKVPMESDGDNTDEDDNKDDEEDDVNDDEADGDIDNNDDGESEESDEANDEDSD